MVSVAEYSDTGTEQSLMVHDPAFAPTQASEDILDQAFPVTGTQINDWWTSRGQDPHPYAKTLFAIKECPPPGTMPSCTGGAVVVPDGGSSTGANPPTLKSFKATFNQGCFCTTYTVDAADPTGGALHYTWSNSNPCGQFSGSDAATATWTHPDSTTPGACPNEPVHPGTITVVVRGGGGSLSCAYAGGSGDGSTVNVKTTARGGR
jgi:hypothetical protein